MFVRTAPRRRARYQRHPHHPRTRRPRLVCLWRHVSRPLAGRDADPAFFHGRTAVFARLIGLHSWRQAGTQRAPYRCLAFAPLWRSAGGRCQRPPGALPPAPPCMRCLRQTLSGPAADDATPLRLNPPCRWRDIPCEPSCQPCRPARRRSAPRCTVLWRSGARWRPAPAGPPVDAACSTPLASPGCLGWPLLC